MRGSHDWLDLIFGLKSLAEEVIPAEARIDRAIFWPSFGPYAAITIRDLGEVGEVELVASGLDTYHFQFRELGPPDRWTEAQTLSSEALKWFRQERVEIQPEWLSDVRPDYQYRDGIHFEGEIRLSKIHHEFSVHDDRDIWAVNPAHERFFLAVWRLANEVLEADWSRRILDPRHYGDLLARECPQSRTKRRRS